MKIIFFNINGGRTDSEGIKNFIKENEEDTDIFCFQESTEDVQKIVNKILIDYQPTFINEDAENPNLYHISTYIKKDHNLIRSENTTSADPNLGPTLFTKIQCEKAFINLINHHGVPDPGDKTDTEVRETQVKNIINYLRNINGLKVIGGDFNLLPNTKCIQMFKEAGYRNLIKEFNIKTTRNEIAWNKYPTTKQYYSDYIFISPEVKVKSFEVPYCEFSDHLPLILEIEV